MAKKNYTWKLESDVVDKLQLLAEKEHRSLTNYIEWLFMTKLNPNSLIRLGSVGKKIKKNEPTKPD